LGESANLAIGRIIRSGELCDRANYAIGHLCDRANYAIGRSTNLL
jgi:hypothetical protein